MRQNRRETDRALDELDELIINEPDSKDKRFLIILKTLTQHAERTTEALETFNDNVKTAIEEHERKLQVHDNRAIAYNASKKILITFMSGALTVMVGVFGYGYMAIANIRTELTIAQTQIEGIQTQKENIKMALDNATEVPKKLIQAFSDVQDQIDQHQEEISRLENGVTVIKSKRAFKAMK